MNVFLTGGTGFIGKALVSALLRRGWQVTALVRRPGSADARAIEAMGARLVQGDIGDREALRAAMQGAGAVIHNAGWYEFGLPRRDQQIMKEVNERGVENVLGLACDLGIPRIVHISSIMAHGQTGLEPEDETYQRKYPPTSIYEETKTTAHELAQALQRSGAPLVIASPAGVVGPGDHSPLGYMSRMFIRGFNIPVMAIGSRATVHVDDCAEGIALAAEKGRPGEEYLLSGGNITTRDMIETWKRRKGGPRFSLYLPRAVGAPMCASLVPLQRLLRLPNIFSSELFVVGSCQLNYTGAKAERELGAHFRDPVQAWLDTLDGEIERMAAGRSWRDLNAA